MSGVPKAGLCEHCSHAKRTASARGSVFFLCRRHEQDSRFAKYPRLPVVQCSGYVPESSDPQP
jgi:hypothetical protein